MTTAEVKKIETALSIFLAKAKAERTVLDSNIWRITLPIRGYNGEDFRMYIYNPPKSRKIVLTDAGSVIREMSTLGSPNLGAVQKLLATFGVMLMEDRSIMERSDRPIPIRVMSYFQAWCAVDGMLRIWNATKEETASDLRPTK